MRVDIPSGAINPLVVASLKEAKECFNIPCRVPKVSFDIKEEKKYIKKMNKAFDLLIDYYGG
jgi:hypothetical protein